LGYRLSNAAEKDVASIFRGGASKFGLNQAESYHAGLERTFRFLAANPFAARERTEFTPPVRIHLFGAHVVLYRIVGADIRIVRVLYGRQNWVEWVWEGWPPR
jgi:toxin ParE1/3/4